MFSTRNFELNGEIKYGYHGSYTVCDAVAKAVQRRSAAGLPLPDFMQVEVSTVEGAPVTHLLDYAAVASFGRGSVNPSVPSVKTLLALLDDNMELIETVKFMAADFGFECSFHAGAVVAHFTTSTAERPDGFVYEVEIDGMFAEPDTYKRAITVGVQPGMAATCRELLFPVLVDSIIDSDYSIFKYGITGAHFVRRVTSDSVFFVDVDAGGDFLCVGVVKDSPFSQVVPRLLYDNRGVVAAASAGATDSTPDTQVPSDEFAAAALPSSARVYVDFDGVENQYVFRLGQHMIGPTGRALSGQALITLCYISAYAKYHAADQQASLVLGGDGNYIAGETSVSPGAVYGSLASTHLSGVLDRLVTGVRTGLFLRTKDGLVNLVGPSNENCFALALGHLFVNMATGVELAMPFDHLEAVCALVDSGALTVEVNNGVTSLVGTGDSGFDGLQVAKSLPRPNTHLRQDVYRRVTTRAQGADDAYQACADGQYAVFGFDRAVANASPGAPDHYIVVKRSGEDFIVIYDPLEFVHGYAMGVVIPRRTLDTLRDFNVVVLEEDGYVGDN